jgi:hypothetical protein
LATSATDTCAVPTSTAAARVTASVHRFFRLARPIRVAIASRVPLARSAESGRASTIRFDMASAYRADP